MSDSYESTFYHQTAAFYRTKISGCVKKLLSFENQLSNKFPIEIYRKNLIKIWLFWSKNLKMFDKICQILTIFYKHDFLIIMQVRIFSSNMKLGSWTLVQVYLYMVSTNPWNRFLNFWFFWKYCCLCPKFQTFSQFCP